MSWLLVLTPLLFAESSAKTTPELPADVLNNLAALQSAENILVHIEDLTNTLNSDTPKSTTKTVVTDKESTKQTSSLIDSDPLLGNGRRYAGAPPLDSRYDNVKGLEVLYEIKRRLQQVQNNITPPPGEPLLVTQFAPQSQYESPNRHIIPYYGLPPRPVAGQPSHMYPPAQQTTQPQNLRLLGFNSAIYAKSVTKLLERNEPILQQAPGAQLLPAVQKPPPPRSVLGSQPRTPLVTSSTVISEWFRDISEARRARRPMGSQSVDPQLPGQPSYSQFSSWPTTEIISTLPEDALMEAAILEAKAKMMTRSRWREPPQSFNTPPPTLLLPQRPMSSVSLLPQRPMSSVSLPPLPPPPLPPVPRAILNPRLPEIMRPNANALPRAYSRLPVNAALRMEMVSQLPVPKTPNRYKVISVTDSSRKLRKLMAFLKHNRDALLQFIAMKRRQLLTVATEPNRGGNGVALLNRNDVRNRLPGRAPPVLEALIRSNGGDGNALIAGKQLGEGKGVIGAKDAQAKRYTSEHPPGAANPIIRALPVDYPEHRFDLAPAKGEHIDHMRYKDRICQRNVMQVAGPKYDSKARVRLREFRPGVDGRAFRVTKRKRLLVPACCNCCKKSVLGCQ